MKKYFPFLLLICLSAGGLAQNTVIIKGHVEDVQTEAPIENANVYFKKSAKGTITNSAGYFEVTLQKGSVDTFTVSCIGYESKKIGVTAGKKNNFSIKLQAVSFEMGGLVIRPTKEKYSKKNNPAVELQERVIARRDSNRLERNDYYQYRQHEVVQLAVNNFSDSVSSFINKMLKMFDFSTKYIDFSDLNNKSILPIYITENAYTSYYNKHLGTLKKHLAGNKSIYVHRMVDMEGFETLSKQIFEKVDIYENSVRIFGMDFMSPLAPLASTFYKFYIIDTVLVGTDSCINLQFFPRNTNDIGFLGNLYIVKDTTSFAIRKAELRLPPKAGINWIDELLVLQEYEYIDGNWCLVKDEALADMSAVSKNFFSFHVRRSNTYKDYAFHIPKPDSLYRNPTEILKEPDYKEKHDTIWQDSLRLRTLRPMEANTYVMFDELRSSLKFKTMVSLMMIAMSGYVPAGFIDIGPINAIGSYNDIEGFRFRVGGRTNTLFHKQLFLNAYAAYGTYDERFKYMIGINYSFNKKRFFMSEYPANMLSVYYRQDNSIPGIPFSLNNGYDGFLSSFRTSPITKMTADKTYSITYDRDFTKGISAKLSFFNTVEEALGEMNFNTPAEDRNKLTTSQFGINMRFTKNERVFQMNGERRSINNSNPVFELTYNLGVKDLFHADYTFHRLELGISKRTYFSGFGYLDLWLNGGKVWNPIPYPLLFIPQGNQGYFAKKDEYNLMNISEFASDQFISFTASYMSSGFLFNRIPLIRRLYWREAFMFKSVWGSLNPNNLPQNNSDLMYFPTSADGSATMFSLESTPYVEASFGIANIFNVLRVDFLKRFTYLDNPNALSWGIKVSLQFEF